MPDELPAGLRARGAWPPRRAPRVAIVGSRRPTAYGEAVAHRVALQLAQAGVVVISGLARGIDAAAHEGALAGEGLTIAVLGSGLDVIYPKVNVGLADRIVRGGGALVSEFADGTPPVRQNFPRRNWTMAALAEVVVVVEAAAGSGSLITADAALQQGREVMAVPGSVFSPQSVGCHQLLRDGAGLLQNARDVFRALGQAGEVLDDPLCPPEPGTTAGRDPLLSHLSEALPLTAELLSRRLELPFAQVLGRLTALELEGRVHRQGDGYVRLIGAR